ncbi:hypothetical protein ACHAXT_005736 [Thalassiosira profunda]
MPLQTVGQTTFTLRSDVPEAFRGRHRAGILHARQRHKGGHDEYAFAWLDDNTNLDVVHVVTSHLNRFGFDPNKMYFLPYTSKDNWRKRYPHACPYLEAENGHVRSVPSAWPGGGRALGGDAPLVAQHDLSTCNEQQLEEQAEVLEQRLALVRGHIKQSTKRAADGDANVGADDAFEDAKPPAKKKAKYDPSKVRICSVAGCRSQARQKGVCVRHGAKNECRHEGCTNHAKRGGVCVRHGATIPRCKHPGCRNVRVKNGVCHSHGAEKIKKQCTVDGCTNQQIRKGVCVRHGAESITTSYEGGMMVQSRKICSVDRCSNVAKVGLGKEDGGYCYKHGLEPKYCKYKGGCSNKPQNKEGFCYEHGAERKVCEYDGGCSNYAMRKGYCRRHFRELHP